MWETSRSSYISFGSVHLELTAWQSRLEQSWATHEQLEKNTDARKTLLAPDETLFKTHAIIDRPIMHPSKKWSPRDA